MNLLEEKNRIIKFLREKLDEEGKNGYVIGVSGGLDSAVVLYLLLEAVGKDKIFALIMPEMDSEPSSLRDALFLVRNLDVPYKVFSLTNTLWVLGVYKIIPLFWLLLRPLKKKAVRYLYEEYSKSLGKPIFFAQRGKVNSKRFRWFYEGIAYYRIKHRLRMILLYFYAEKRIFS